MIVDDHVDFRRLVRLLLQPIGAEFIECNNGLEALEQCAQFPPDLVLMDIEMTGMDGLSATAQITTHFPAASVIILSQYDDPDLRAAAQAAGACGYVLKENLSQLSGIVRDHLFPPGPDQPPQSRINL